MPDFTADEDIQGSNMTPEEETKPEVKVQEKSVEIRQGHYPLTIMCAHFLATGAILGL